MTRIRRDGNTPILSPFPLPAIAGRFPRNPLRMHELPLDRVGIVMMSAVGDAVHVLPVVNAIKRSRPESHITWVLQPGPARLVRGHPAVDEIILFERSRGLRAFTD